MENLIRPAVYPSLEDRVVMVTGGSSGIGEAVVEAFAMQNAQVVFLDIQDDASERLIQRLGLAGLKAPVYYHCDLTDIGALQKTVRDLLVKFPRVDVLVNNAGLSRGLAKLYEDDPQNWEEMIDTNVKGLLYVTRSVVPGMVARGRGHVINLGSTAAYITYANGAVYCATKAAEKSISEGLKIDLMGTPVRVTSVDPGMVETNFSKVRFRGDEERAAKVYENITPLRPEDIADAIVWAASRPAHVNIHTVVMTTIDQANSTVFNRRS